MAYRSISSRFVETKYKDVYINSTIVGPDDFGGTNPLLRLTPIVALAQGTDENNRIGNKVGVSSVHLYGTVTKLASSGILANLINTDKLRFMMILDRQTNGVALQISDVLNLSGGGQYIDSFRQLNRSTRFSILKDEFVNFDSDGLTYNATGAVYATTAVAKHVEWHHKFKKPCVIEFDSINGNIAEFKTNNIYIVLMSISNTLYFHGKTRIRFTD